MLTLGGVCEAGPFGTVPVPDEVPPDEVPPDEAGGEELAGGVLAWTSGFFGFDGELDGQGPPEDPLGGLEEACEAGAPLPVRPGSGVVFVLAGLDVSTGGEKDAGGVVEAGAEDDGLIEMLAGALELVVREGSCAHRELAGPGFCASLEAALALVASCEPPPPPPLPPCETDPLFAAPDTEVALGDSTCGRLVSAKAPAATTKIAVPMAAAGRSQVFRGRA